VSVVFILMLAFAVGNVRQGERRRNPTVFMSRIVVIVFKNVGSIGYFCPDMVTLDRIRLFLKARLFLRGVFEVLVSTPPALFLISLKKCDLLKRLLEKKHSK
jgi:hypothetical protein